MKLAPKKLFLIDSLGALLSTILLGIVVVQFESSFGMPRKVLYYLSIIAFVFSIYSFTSYLLANKNWKLCLKIIGFANLLYCLLTVGLVFYFYQELTIPGLIYFFIEIAVILLLVSIELKTAFSSTK